MPLSAIDSRETHQLLEQIRVGEAAALDILLRRHRSYLRKLVAFRLDPRLRGRVDPSDVIQETQIEATRRIGRYVEQPPMSFRLWLRQLAYDRLLMVHRRHAGAQRRDVRRETTLPDQSSLQLAQQAIGTAPTPSQVLIRDEFADRVREAIARLSGADRDVLIMRHFEGLSNQEVAETLQLEPAAASKRYGRALLRLRTHLLERGVGESQA